MSTCDSPSSLKLLSPFSVKAAPSKHTRAFDVSPSPSCSAAVPLTLEFSDDPVQRTPFPSGAVTSPV